MYFAGISGGKTHLYRSRCPPFSMYPFKYVWAAHHNAITPQAAKNVRTSQDALFGIFERLEAFFQRLEIYTGAALDQKMLETVTKIMVEVLNIIGIATKEIKQGQASKYFLYKDVHVHRSISEKYVKKLLGKRSDVEDALKRLDSLTQEEAQMAAAQVLKATHTVDETGTVRGVADIVVSVDSRVAGVSDQVQSVGDQVQGVGDQVHVVNDQVQGVSDQVQGVGDQVQVVSDQVQNISDQVQGVGGQVQGISGQVHDISDQVQGVNDNVTATMDGA